MPSQPERGTVAIGAGDWLLCGAVASSVLWLREASKVVSRALKSNSLGSIDSKRAFALP